MKSALQRTSDESRAIVKSLRDHLRALERKKADRVTETVSSYWIGWRSRNHARVFAELRPLRGRVEVFILPKLQELRDPSGLARAAPRTQGWGWFRTRFDVRGLAEAGHAFRLIRQSYDWSAKPGNGGPSRALRRLRTKTA